MNKTTAEKVKTFSALTGTFILIGTSLVGVAGWSYSTFATNKRVDKIEEKQSFQDHAISSQQKISCKIAIKIGVKESELHDLCQLDTK